MSAVAWRIGAHAVPLLTRVSPILQGDGRTEAYLTQPTLLGSLAWKFLSAQAALSLEGLTLERGELGAGSYGEGYVDRRHPHTYLHELVITAGDDVGPVSASLTAGRGFAAFGTDDPMMRPFVKFPVNHHLGQVLERLLVAGAVRAGPVIAEASVFGGNEPLDPADMGRMDRFGDSWSARLTLLPGDGVEVQGSYAWVESPELPSGGGLNQRKLSASARYARQHAFGALYALAEWKRTTEVSRDSDLFAAGSVLGEVELDWRGWRPALRLERSERVEGERAFDPFRTPWPHADTHVLGITEWTIAAARIARVVSIGALRMAPFIEGSFSHVQGNDDDLFEPAAFYGDTQIWTLNIGARLSAGWHPARMGRYGAAAPPAPAAHTH